jgi:general secretion pathway protein B
MSYILDALKKSDQQRQLGATPTLQAAQVTVAAPKRHLFIYYGLLAVVLLGAGILIGWLRPWQTEQPVRVMEPVAAIPPISNSQQAASAPLATPPVMSGAMKPGDNPALVNTVTTGVAAPVPEKTKQEKSGNIDEDALKQNAVPFDELPVQIQREIPEITVQLHAYSSKPGESLVYINAKRMREGESVKPGLMLEQITPDGMVFTYKGYRFKRGIR